MALSALQVAGRRVTFRNFARVWFCLAVAAPVLLLLTEHLAEMDREQIGEALRRIPLWSLALSAGLTALSLFAVARYDLLALGQVGLRVPDAVAIRGGFAAVGLGQTLGFGLVVGSLVRWRMYRAHGVSLAEAGLVSAVVAAGFMLGFAIVLATSTAIAPHGLALLTGGAPDAIRGWALWGVAGAGILLAASVAQPALRVGRFSLRLPPVRLLVRQTVLAALDVLPAAAALFVLVPPDSGITLAMMIPVYLAALGVGLVSSTPGGLGVLELACLTALPVVPPETLLAALIAHRAIYFGLPALVAAAILVAREVHGQDDGAGDGHEVLKAEGPGRVPGRVAALVAGDGRADAALAYLGDKDFIVAAGGRAALAVARSGNSLVALSDPLGRRDRVAAVAEAFGIEARRRGLAPVYYKVGPDFARFATGKGMVAVQCGVEAVLDPARFSLDGASRRELRRKLRGAEKAGVAVVRHRAGAAPMAALLGVARQWRDARGGARGFSMGHCDSAYLNRFEIVTAEVAGRVIGFVSLWRSGDGGEAGIDVLRLEPGAPDGTMHALVVAAIGRARETGARRFTLAAVPLGGIDAASNLLERVLATLFRKAEGCAGNRGLQRFKAAFRPEWEPRYVVATSQGAAAMGLIDAARLINRKGLL